MISRPRSNRAAQWHGRLARVFPTKIKLGASLNQAHLVTAPESPSPERGCVVLDQPQQVVRYQERSAWKQQLTPSRSGTKDAKKLD